MVDTWPSGYPSSYGTGSGFSTPTSRSYSPSAATYESWNDQDGWDAVTWPTWSARLPASRSERPWEL